MCIVVHVRAHKQKHYMHYSILQAYTDHDLNKLLNLLLDARVNALIALQTAFVLLAILSQLIPRGRAGI